MSPKSKINSMEGWIQKVRCTKKLEEQTLEAVTVSGETYPEYIRKSIEERNKRVLRKDKIK